MSVSSSMFNCSLCWPWAYVKPVFLQSCAVAGEIRCYAVFQRLQANNKTVVCFVWLRKGGGGVEIIIRFYSL